MNFAFQESLYALCPHTIDSMGINECTALGTLRNPASNAENVQERIHREKAHKMHIENAHRMHIENGHIQEAQLEPGQRATRSTLKYSRYYSLPSETETLWTLNNVDPCRPM